MFSGAGKGGVGRVGGDEGRSEGAMQSVRREGVMVVLCENN